MPLPASLPQYEKSDIPVMQEYDSESATPKKHFHIGLGMGLVILYGIILYGIVGYSLYKKNIFTSESKTETSLKNLSFQSPRLNDVSSEGSSSSFEHVSSLTTDKLPLIKFTLKGSPIEASSSLYPHPIPIELSKDIFNKVSSYQFGNFVFVGPKDWIGEAFIVDKDMLIYLYPKDNVYRSDIISGPYMLVTISPRGAPGLEHASQFFQWPRDHASELNIVEKLKPVVLVSSSSAISKHLITFENPFIFVQDKIDTYGTVYGVAFSDAEAHLQDKQWTTIIMEIGLENEEKQFAQEIINTFIGQYDLKNK